MVNENGLSRYQRQLSILPKNVTGTPSKLKLHKFRIIDEVVDANVTKAPAGHADREAECFRERLSMDFNFTQASSVQYKKRKGMTRVVKSQQGYTATLTIVDQKMRKLFAFPTAGKSPPLHIVKAFLDRYKIGYGRTRYIRTNQGGELARSTQFCQLLLSHNCILEPTGSDAASENGW